MAPRVTVSREIFASCPTSPLTNSAVGSNNNEITETVVIVRRFRRRRNGLTREKLPASSAYYTTSASKAKILNQMKEKLAGGENPYQDQVSSDEINRKKMELIMSISNKLGDLQNMKGVLADEMRENERLGRQVHKLTEQVCSGKELDKYRIFVQDVDKIINLLLSLSGRLARVENTIQMLSTDADKQEKESLCLKRKKLNEQHQEAKQLKENIDRRQKVVSDILARNLNCEQFADFEHFIQMKSALIMEQRELDDKIRLGREQMNCLRESLPSDWQCNLDKLIEE